MKKTILLFLLFVSSIFISCTSKNNSVSSTKTIESDTEIIAKKIKEYINTNANDPSSYQPISTVFSDSLTYVKDLTSQIEGAKQTLDFDKEERRLYGASAPSTYASEAKTDHKHLDSLKNLKDSILKTNNPYRVEYYYYLHSCRLKNGYGGLTKSTYRVITDPFLNIIQMNEIK